MRAAWAAEALPAGTHPEQARARQRHAAAGMPLGKARADTCSAPQASYTCGVWSTNGHLSCARAWCSSANPHGVLVRQKLAVCVGLVDYGPEGIRCTCVTCAVLMHGACAWGRVGHPAAAFCQITNSWKLGCRIFCNRANAPATESGPVGTQTVPEGTGRGWETPSFQPPSLSLMT